MVLIPDTASDNFAGGAIVDVGGVDGTHPDTASDNFAGGTIVDVGGVDGTHPDTASDNFTGGKWSRWYSSLILLLITSQVAPLWA